MSLQTIFQKFTNKTKPHQIDMPESGTHVKCTYLKGVALMMLTGLLKGIDKQLYQKSINNARLTSPGLNDCDLHDYILKEAADLAEMLLKRQDISPETLQLSHALFAEQSYVYCYTAEIHRINAIIEEEANAGV